MENIKTKEELLKEKAEIERALLKIDIEEKRHLLENLEKEGKFITEDFKKKMVGQLIEFNENSESSSSYTYYIKVEDIYSYNFSQTSFYLKIKGQRFSCQNGDRRLLNCYITKSNWMHETSIRMTYKGVPYGKNSHIKVLSKKEAENVINKMIKNLQNTFSPEI